jgi:hypothetical protein
MGSKICELHSFLIAAKGNWRNAVFIKCGKCSYGRKSLCSGFLMIPDAAGQPVVIPAGAVRVMTGVAVDKTECRVVLDRQAFETLYASWLEWNVPSPGECTLSQLVSQNSCEMKSPCCYQKFSSVQCV